MMIQEYHCTFHEGRNDRHKEIMSQVPRHGDWVLINNILYEIEQVTFDMTHTRTIAGQMAVSVLIRKKTKQF